MRLSVLAAAALLLAGCAGAGTGDARPSDDTRPSPAVVGDHGTAAASGADPTGDEAAEEDFRARADDPGVEPLPPSAPAGRPYLVYVPDSSVQGEEMPLVIVLHGWGSSGDGMRRYLEVEQLAEERGFLVVHPNGSVGDRGSRFWDATDACCNFGGPATDDAEYLTRVITEVSDGYSVDPARVHLVGYSNGGFMAYRMACEHADLLASVASISGATYADPEDCDPGEPVSVLQVHGDADRIIRYEGGRVSGPYPGAEQTVTTWAAYDGCDPTPVGGDPRDLDADAPGPESPTLRFDGCPDGVGVELWTIPGAGHLPRVSAGFPTDVVDWLLAHPDE